MIILFCIGQFYPVFTLIKPDEPYLMHYYTQMISAIVDTHPTFITGMSLVLTEILPGIKIIKSENFRAFGSLKYRRKLDFIILGVNTTIKIIEWNEIRFIRKKFPHSKMIILYDQISMVIPLLSLNIQGFLSKKNSQTELRECLDQVLNNQKYLDNEIYELILKTS